MGRPDSENRALPASRAALPPSGLSREDASQAKPADANAGGTRFKPGKLNSLQRDYIIAASSFLNGEPIPFARGNAPYQGQHSLNGLIQRGIMDERRGGFCYLTENGYRVAVAIHRLLDRHHEAREIEAHLDALARARGDA